MLLDRFKKIYSRRLSGPTKNRIGLTKKLAGGTKKNERKREIILKSSSTHRPQIRIYPSENFGGIVVN